LLIVFVDDKKAVASTPSPQKKTFEERLSACKKHASKDKKQMKPTTFLKCSLPSEDFLEAGKPTHVLISGETYPLRHVIAKVHVAEQVVPATDIVLPNLFGCFKAKFLGADESAAFISSLRNEKFAIAERLKQFETKVSFEPRTLYHIYYMYLYVYPVIWDVFICYF